MKIKKLICLLLAVAALFSLSACGKKEKAVDIKAADLVGKIKDALGDGYMCSVDMDEERFAGFFGLDMTKVEDWAAQECMITSIQLDTVVIVKVKSGYENDTVAALKTRSDNLQSYAKLYGMDDPKITDCRLYSQSGYVALIVAGATPDYEASAADKAKLAASEYAKVDAVWKEVFGSVPENLAK